MKTKIKATVCAFPAVGQIARTEISVSPQTGIAWVDCPCCKGEGIHRGNLLCRMCEGGGLFYLTTQRESAMRIS